MNKRPIDRSKKSNIYCAHCEHWADAPLWPRCRLTGKITEYWKRCKQFEWKKDAMYLDEMF